MIDGESESVDGCPVDYERKYDDIPTPTEVNERKDVDVPTAIEVNEHDTTWNTGEVTDATVINTDNKAITSEQKALAFNIAHDCKTAAHASAIRTYRNLRANGYGWRGMKKETRKYVRECHICQAMNREPRSRLPVKRDWLNSSTPWSTLAIDIMIFHTMGVGGYRYALVVMDIYSKFVEATLLKNTTSAAIANILVDLFLRRGSPHTIMTDSGSNLVSTTMQQVYKQMDINKQTSSPYHQRANGAVERAIGSIKSTLRKLVLANKPNDKRQWTTLLKFAVAQYNGSIHSTTGVTPDYAISGYDKQILVRTPNTSNCSSTIANNTTVDKLLTTLQQTAESIADKRHQHFKTPPTDTTPALTIGGMVYLRRQGLLNTLEPRWQANYTITDIQHDGHTIIVRNNHNGHLQIANRDNVKPAYTATP